MIPNPAVPLRFVTADALRHVRLSANTFTRQTLLAGKTSVADLYCLDLNQTLSVHRHPDAEHLLCVLEGEGEIQVGDDTRLLGRGSVAVVPCDTYHQIRNTGAVPLIVVQLSSPKPWDARFGGPRPVQLAPDLPPME